jgi:signal-transduction protein with cAMP-binding, CBS, and nucleotidyltransferase domain
VVSEGDLLKPFADANQLRRDWWLGLLAEGESLAPVFLDYIGHDHRAAAGETASIPELAALMAQHKIKRVLIRQAGKLTGIVSRCNIVRVLSHNPQLLRRGT